jgi:hypothetical protein
VITQNLLRLIVILTAMLILIGLNIAASALKVPQVTATIGDITAGLMALAALLLKDATPPHPPAPPAPPLP